jgi:flagellin
MSLRINQNISAMTAHRWTQTNDASMAKSIERLSSGFRINSAADDAAGLVISETLRTQISGLTVAQRNTQDAVNMIKTTEKALDEVTNQLRNVRDLALGAASANGNKSVISANQAQVDKALQSIDRIAEQTEFAGQKLLADDTGTNSIENKVFQIGAQSGQTATFSATGTDFGGKTLTTDMHASALGFSATAGTYAKADGGTFNNIADGNTEDFNVVWQKADGTTDTFNFQIEANGADLTIDTATDAINAQLKAKGYDGLLEATNDGTKVSIGVVDRMENLAEQSSASKLTVYSNPLDSAEGTGFAFAGKSGAGARADSGITLSQNPADYTTLLENLDTALSKVEGLRAALGAFQKNTLESNLASLGVTQENLQNSESAIRDTDMAAEMVSFTRAQILTQAGQSMMTQANQAPQNILQMLRG